MCLTTISETSITFNFHTHNFRKFSPQAFTQTSKSFARWKTVNKPVLVIDL